MPLDLGFSQSVKLEENDIVSYSPSEAPFCNICRYQTLTSRHLLTTSIKKEHEEKHFNHWTLKLMNQTTVERENVPQIKQELTPQGPSDFAILESAPRLNWKII